MGVTPNHPSRAWSMTTETTSSGDDRGSPYDLRIPFTAIIRFPFFSVFFTARKRKTVPRTSAIGVSRKPAWGRTRPRQNMGYRTKRLSQCDKNDVFSRFGVSTCWKKLTPLILRIFQMLPVGVYICVWQKTIGIYHHPFPHGIVRSPSEPQGFLCQPPSAYHGCLRSCLV